jgi:hypothetical protein
VPFVTILHPMATAVRDTITQQACDALPQIAAALSKIPKRLEVPDNKTSVAENFLEVSGGFAEVNELFHERGWSDGLPIVPPTEENVGAMLSQSIYPKDESLGLIPPEMNPMTVERLAINAVMAGCVPEFFPVVLAAAKSLVHDDLALYSMQTATNATTPLVIVNGPATTTLCMNAGANLFGSGNRANATIGRAIRLILLNIGKEIPGVSDPATHGQPGKYTYCIAEAETESPWEPLHVENGFAKDQSTVSLIGAGGPQNLFTYGCKDGTEILETFVGALTGLGHNNILFPSGPLFVIGPEHAHTLARDGFSKRDVKQYLFERARIPLARFAEGSKRGIFERRARWFEVAGDRDQIGIADHPEDIVIVVAGGAGIHSQFLPTAFSKKLVTIPIKFKT